MPKTKSSQEIREAAETTYRCIKKLKNNYVVKRLWLFAT